MKLLSLNTWYGTCKSELKDFLSSQLPSTDIFCLQESEGEGVESVITELFDSSEFECAETKKFIHDEHRYSSHTIVKKPSRITYSEALLDDEDPNIGRALATNILVGAKHISVINVHGVPFPGHKLDTGDRLRQTEQILKWPGSNGGLPTIICGDFNLLPETRSIKKFTASGYQNLISDYDIPTTRNELAWEQHPDNIQLFADYTFVSPDIQVTDFTVPNIAVSDHLPMIIDVVL